MLRAIFRGPVTRQFQADKVGHHAAAGKVAAGSFAVTGEVGQPADGPALHRYSRGTDGVGADVLVESRADEVTDDAVGIGRGGDQSHVAGMSNMRAVGKQLLFEFLQDVAGLRWFLWQRLVEEAMESAGLDIREHRAAFNVFQIVGQKINYAMAQVTKFIGLHAASRMGRWLRTRNSNILAANRVFHIVRASAFN